MEGARHGHAAGVDAIRILAGGLAVNRILLGAGLDARPQGAQWSWIDGDRVS